MPAGSADLRLAQSEIVLHEGAAEASTLELSIMGSAAAGLTLSLRAADPAELDELDYWFTPPQQSGAAVSSRLNLQLQVAMAPLQDHSRELIVVADDGFRQTEALLRVQVKPVHKPDVYLLIGQSNMEGYGEYGAKNAAPGGPDQPHQRIRQLNVQSNDPEHFPDAAAFTDETLNTVQPLLIMAEDPLHQPLTADKTTKGGTYIGPGMAFAKAALVDTTQSIYLVPAAWSGTGFCASSNAEMGWNAVAPADPALRGTLLADRALTRLNMTLRETEGIFRGILWHQGESDSHDSHCADLYAQNLEKLITRIRSEAAQDLRGPQARGPQADVPLVLGTMSRGQDVRGDYSFFGDSKSKVDAAHRAIASVLPYADYSNNDDLVPPAFPCGENSCIHFGAAANREQGRRLYQALRRVVERR